MKIPPKAIEELRRICRESFHLSFTDAELQEISLRIVKFLMNGGEEQSGGHVAEPAPDMIDLGR